MSDTTQLNPSFPIRPVYPTGERVRPGDKVRILRDGRIGFVHCPEPNGRVSVGFPDQPRKRFGIRRRTFNATSLEFIGRVEVWKEQVA